MFSEQLELFQKGMIQIVNEDNVAIEDPNVVVDGEEGPLNGALVDCHPFLFVKFCIFFLCLSLKKVSLIILFSCILLLINLIHGCQIWVQSESDWPQMGQIR